MAIKRIGVLTGGGDCPGLNAVIRAITKSAILKYGLEVIGIEDGFLGLIEKRVQPLSFLDVSNILDKGGTILGTSNKADPSRYAVGTDEKGKPIFEDVTPKVIETIKEHGIEALICIGGDGTMSGAANLELHGVRIVGVPKTIDNDVMHTELTFGFDTAVGIATEAMDRIRTTASSHHRIMLVETMGRNAGWLALSAGVASGADIILIPEIPFLLDDVCRTCLNRMNHRKSYTIIAVAEGAAPVGGNVVVDRVVHESPDALRLGGVSEVLCGQIAERTRMECRATILGHVQRGGIPTAQDRLLGTRFGYRALKMLMEGEFGRMVTFSGGGLSSWPIKDVAHQQRLVPRNDELIEAARAVGTTFGNPNIA